MKANKLMEELDITPRQLRRIVLSRRTKKPKPLRKHLEGQIVKFGIVSDTHLCSSHEKLDELHTFYQICKKEGITTVLNAGDIVSGWGIYHGQENEVKVFGADRQAQYVVDMYPKIEGIETMFILGNHDLSWWNRSGVNIGERIANQRKDMIYLGDYNANVFINGVKIQLHHGEGGGSYALSYKAQKYVEQIPSGEKPKVIIFGHWHTAFYFWYRNIHVLNGGAFEGQSLFLKRKMINPSIGGWICKMMVTKKGEVTAFEPSWIPFFT